jgi:hypothetical protein
MEHFNAESIDLGYIDGGADFIERILHYVHENTTAANVECYDWWKDTASEEMRAWIWADDIVQRLDSDNYMYEDWYKDLIRSIQEDTPFAMDWVQYDVYTANEWVDSFVAYSSETHNIEEVYAEAHDKFTEYWVQLVVTAVQDIYRLIADDLDDTYDNEFSEWFEARAGQKER